MNWILLTYFFASLIYGIDPFTKLGPCQVKLNNGSEINLKQVANLDYIKHTPRFSGLNATNKSDVEKYSYNPCYSFIYPSDEGRFGPCDVDVAVCQSIAGGNHVIGSQRSAHFKFNKTSKFWSIEYTGNIGDRRTIVTLNCSSNPVDHLEVYGRTNQGNHDEEYRMVLRSPCACPDGCATPVVPRGVSFAAVFFLIMLCFIVLYFCFGCLYRRVVVGATGIESFPHHYFWSTLHIRIMHGCNYVLNCCRPATVTYEQI